jgi:hypothetical protein
MREVIKVVVMLVGAAALFLMQRPRAADTRQLVSWVRSADAPECV